MSKSPTSGPTKVQFTVGKLDAGMAILLTSDHYQIEFPSILLPRTVTTGSVIDLSVSQNPVQEEAVHSRFLALQSTIREAFASKSPSTPVLSLRNATQTSAVLEWEPIDIAMADLKSLTLWRDGTRLGNIPKPLTTTTTKLSGLAIDTEYTFQLVLRTTAGTYSSEPLKVKTHKLSNLAGVTICEGTLPPEQHDRLVSAIEAVGAKALQKRVRIDTTHFVCSVPEGDEYQRAKDMNVPIVVVDWIEACQREGKIVGVRGYYLDADPALRPKGSSAMSPPQSRSSHAGSKAESSTNVEERSTQQQKEKSEGPTAAVDHENEKVLNTAQTVVPPVVTVTDTSSASAPAPESVPAAAVSEVLSEKVEGEKEPEVVNEKVQEPESTSQAPTSTPAEEDKFDDVPI
jgi:chitin biosynthesis protein CHS5